MPLLENASRSQLMRKLAPRRPPKAAVFFLFLHIRFYGTTVDANTYIYAAEIFPNPLRARGIGISISGLFMAVIVFTSAAPTAFDNIGELINSSKPCTGLA